LQHAGRVTGRADRPQSQPRGGQLWNILRPVDTVAVLHLHRPARLVTDHAPAPMAGILSLRIQRRMADSAS
jgi:hypothetical protein